MTTSRWHGSLVTTLLLLMRIAAPAVAQNHSDDASPSSDGPKPTVGPQVSPAAVQPQQQDRAVEAHRRQQVAQLVAQGRHLSNKHQYTQSAGVFAVAYTFDAQPELLIETARACRKAELDYEALTLYERLQMETSAPQYRDEISDELKALHTKIEETEIDKAQTLRDHMDLAKKNFQGEHFSTAAQEYAIAYALKPLPRLLFNTAQAYRRTDRPVEAYILYSRFLDEEPQTPLKKETLGYLSELRPVAFRPPVYKRAWFWTVIGGAAAAGVALGLGFGLQDRRPKIEPVF